MACNCKKKAAIASKYSDEGTFEILSPISKFFTLFFRVIVVIISFAFLLCILPFFLLYLIYNLFMGKNTNIRLDKIFKKLSSKNE